MREILFRGKREENDVWIWGGFNSRDGKAYIIGMSKQGRIDGIEVDPKTVGQYTGLTDKNGTKIFEGDIVKTQERYDRPYSKNRKSKRHIGVVKYQVRGDDKFYNVDTGNWDRHIDYGAEWIVKVEDYGKFVHGAWGDFWDCEVIGNVHDNPELLGGED